MEVAGTFRGAAVTGRSFVERSGFEKLRTLPGFFKNVGKSVRKAVQEAYPMPPTPHHRHRSYRSSAHPSSRFRPRRMRTRPEHSSRRAPMRLRSPQTAAMMKEPCVRITTVDALICVNGAAFAIDIHKT